MSKAPELSEIFVVQDIALKPVSKLETYVNNPKDHPEEQIETLAHLIRNFGFLVPIVEKGNTIAAGEGRLLAAKRLGMELVPTIQAEHLTDEQLRAYRIADNAAARTGWWEDGLRLEVQGLQQLGVDLSLTGLQPAELEVYKTPLTPPARPGPGGGLEGDGDPGPDWLDELQEKWQTALGQIWEIPSKQLKEKAHRIACGDCQDPALLDKLMGGARAEMIFTDPPYGVDYVAENHDKIANDDLERDTLIKFLHNAFTGMIQHAEDEAAFYIWHASETRGEYEYAMKTAGLQERQYLIWAKDSLVLGWADYHWSHEPLFYASKAGYQPRWTGNRQQSTMWRIEASQDQDVIAALGPGLIISDGAGNELFVTSRIPQKKLRTFRLETKQTLTIQGEGGQQTLWQQARDSKPRHPTQKPPALAQRAIKNSSALGDIILDLFLGSGSTLLASEMEARICYGAELSPRHVAGALEWAAEAGLTPVLIDTFTPTPA